jgi:hypothetical protein
LARSFRPLWRNIVQQRIRPADSRTPTVLALKTHLRRIFKDHYPANVVQDDHPRDTMLGIHKAQELFENVGKSAISPFRRFLVFALR